MKSPLIAALSLVAGLAATPAPAPPVGPGAVLAMHQRLFRAIDAGRVDDALAFLHEDMRIDDEFRPRPCTLHLVAADGTSRSAASHTEAVALLADWVGDSAEGTWSTRILGGFDDCYSGELSYGVLEFERSRELDGQRHSQRFRSTSIVTWDGGWKLTHWHVSPVRPAEGAGDPR